MKIINVDFARSILPQGTISLSSTHNRGDGRRAKDMLCLGVYGAAGKLLKPVHLYTCTSPSASLHRFLAQYDLCQDTSRLLTYIF